MTAIPPPTTRATSVLNADASQPMIGAPIGVEPAKTVV
jgi:hypothetical protein